MKEFLKSMFMANKGISSKRVCGVLGFLVCLGIAIYGTVAKVNVPTFLETVLITSATLLGVDSVTNIWKKNESI